MTVAPTRRNGATNQRGASLVELLVALVVLGGQFVNLSWFEPH